MDCPKCNNIMNELTGFSFSAAKCSACSGIWFRDSDHEVAKKLGIAKEIDESKPNASSKQNLIRDFDCPECNSVMIKMVDPAQLTIDLESCSGCYGVFFDEGEFADYSELTLLERVSRAIDTFKINLTT